MISIYSPAVKREAEMFNITPLQAYRKLKAKEEILGSGKYFSRRTDMITII